MFKNSYWLLLAALLLSCAENKEESKRPTSPRIKKFSSIASPMQNQNFVRGDLISISLNTDEEFPIDSIQVVLGDEKLSFDTNSFEILLPNRKVGSWQLRIKAFSGSKSETHYRKVIVLPENTPEEYSYTVEKTIPHNTEDYTQGLLIKDGFLYESTGQRGESTFKKKNLETGEDIQVVSLSSDLFGEGLAVINNEFYQLTWTSGVGFVYNAEMQQTRTFNYQLEGWGLTTLGEQLILTDESEKLYFIEPQSFTILSELEVYDNQGKVDAINELEIIDGLIYANVYQEDFIVVIDPETGEVLRRIDMSGLLTDEERKKADVLNGIAVDNSTKKIYVTGKWWPSLFEVTFQPNSL
ncbi:MAG: glutaminyl-peptide cyclotransferase [Ekhidna sp.]|nr:glutaminyl-peptide cyclotransferase [Ekhidna sp.]